MPADPDADAPVEALARAWAGVPLVDAGVAEVRVEVFDRPRFASSGQGGFRVSCPRTGQNVVPAFNPALEAWRAGGPRVLDCPCGDRHDLASLAYAPQAGFARGWVALVDAGGAELLPDAARIAREILGGLRVVLRRG